MLSKGRLEAADAFEQLAARRPDDPLVHLHHRRLTAGACGDLIELASK